MQRLTLFSFYDPKNEIDKYVIHYLTELRKVSDIIFISDGELNDMELRKLFGLTIYNICVRHEEYDFGSYKRGLKKAKEKGILDNYDFLIIANDSCFGPFCELAPIFDKMESKDIDFWGFTHNTVDRVPHIQSYFVSLNKKVFLSKEFNNLLNNVVKEEIRKNVVYKYEHGLTRDLSEAGFKFSTFFEEKSGVFLHDPAKNWEEMILKGFPFLKRMLFTRNTYQLKNLQTYKQVISTAFPKYNTKLITENLKKYDILIDEKSFFEKLKSLFKRN